jgi:hypothetical protein
MERKLIRYIRFEYPIPDNFVFSRETTDAFTGEVDKLMDFINHELEVINSNFRITKGDEQ